MMRRMCPPARISMPSIAENGILRTPAVEGLNAFQFPSNSEQVLEGFVSRMLRLQTQGTLPGSRSGGWEFWSEDANQGPPERSPPTNTRKVNLGL